MIGNNKFYQDKFIRFLKDNNLLEYKVINYFLNSATFEQVNDFNLTQVFDNWGYVFNCNNKLVKIIPRTPALNSDRAVLFNILAYIRLLNLLLNMDSAKCLRSNNDFCERIDEFVNEAVAQIDSNEFILLFYYGMLYLKQNPDLKLSNQEKKERRKILKNGSKSKIALFKFCEQMLDNDQNDSIAKLTRSIKVKAKKKEFSFK